MWRRSLPAWAEGEQWNVEEDVDMGSIVRLARAYATLTPGERALVRLIEGLVCAALVAALPIIAEALARQQVNWDDVLRAALAAGATAALLALHKYLRAQGDPPLATPTAGADAAGGK